MPMYTIILEVESILKLFKEMISTFRFFIWKVNINSRLQSTSARESRILKKMLKKGLIKEKKNFQTHTLLKKSNLNSAFDNEGSQRMTVFNKVYMENITHMFYCGECGQHLQDLGVEFTKVQISRGLNYLNIYYITKKTPVDEEFFKNVLKKAVSEIQTKMGDLKFFGKVPYVRLINDLRLEHEIKLENIFKCMDLNEDSAKAKHISTPYFAMNRDDLPQMRQDVLGIDVAKIKARISNDIFRFKAININFPTEVEESEIPTKLIKFSKKDFYKFYKRRRIEELKRRKKERQEVYLIETEDDFDEDLIYECDDDIEYDCEEANDSVSEFEFPDNFERESDDEFEESEDEFYNDVEHKYADELEDKSL